jgi:hypothetical protein
VTETLGTFVYLKNATDHELEYHASLNFPGGQYALGRAKIAAHETVAIDLRALRDAQRPDAVGNLIPPDAQAGQFLWSIHGTEMKSIIGRAEQADFINGFSSSYACFNCCPDSFGNGWISGSVFSFPVGGSGLFNAFESYQNCYGGTTGTWRVSNAAWAVGPAFLGSFAPAFQSVQFTAATPGNGLLEATWPVFHRDMICEPVFENFTASAPVTVATVFIEPGPRKLVLGGNAGGQQAVGNQITLTGTGDPDGGGYVWSTTSQNVALANANSRTVTVTAQNASASPNDIVINLSYLSPDGQTVSTSTTLTVQRPTSFQLVRTESQGPSVSDGVPGYTRIIIWQVVDQFSQPIQVDQMTVADMLAPGNSLTCGFDNPKIGSDETSASGQFRDTYSYHSSGCSPGGPGCRVEGRQSWIVNGVSLGIPGLVNIVYTCNSITLNGQ